MTDNASSTSTPPATGVGNVAGLVDYQAGGIASRQVVKKPGGNVTLFAFDAGQELTEHTSPFDALAHVLEGEADIAIAGQAHRVRAGEILLMPANIPHAVTAVARFKMLLTMIR